jgi:hypothetical protein
MKSSPLVYHINLAVVGKEVRMFKPFSESRQPGVEADCGGFSAHAMARVGESLIGWYKTEDEASDALFSYYEKFSVVIDGDKTDNIVCLHENSSDNFEYVRLHDLKDNVIFDGPFGAWAARHLKWSRYG